MYKQYYGMSHNPFEKDLDKFFSDLNKETLEVQKRFLMIRNGEQESAYAQSLCSNCIEASREIIKLYNRQNNFRLTIF